MRNKQRASLLELIKANEAQSRIQSHRDQVAQFEELARAEGDYKLRSQLLTLAARYHELAERLERDNPLPDHADHE
jgi:hypothetical protein